MFQATRIPAVRLTVVIRDESPLIHMQEPVNHRTVHIELTQEQREQLALKCVGRAGGTDLYEQIASAFLED